jgi:hypothetical protein
LCGFVYRTPMPVQPMKAAGAIATTQAAQTLIITPAMVWGASLATGIVWLVLGLTGTAHHVAKLITRPVVLGIILGLGFGFMIEGAKNDVAELVGRWRRLARHIPSAQQSHHSGHVPAAAVRCGYGILSDPTLVERTARSARRAAHADICFGQSDLERLHSRHGISGSASGPADTRQRRLLAITEENNRLFPNRPVNESKISTSTGLMNLLSASVGGVPMCHGAGGMAGHVQFGARTGGALVILGIVLLVTATLFSGSVGTLLRLFPPEHSRRHSVLDGSPSLHSVPATSARTRASAS